MNISIIAQIVTIVVGIATFYGVVTKPIKDSIEQLADKIDEMNKETFDTKIQVARIDESVKSAHKRINDLEGK